MTRNISTINKDATNADVVRPIWFAELLYDSGTVRAHNGVGTIVWGGNTFLGVGNFGNISDIDEDTELSISKVSLTLSGVDSNNISIALNEKYQGRVAIIYKGYLDENLRLKDDPTLQFRGKIDTQSIELGKQGIITVSIINRLADWEKTRTRRYNNDDQQNEFPGDKGMEFVPRSVEKQIFWGKKAP